ncbi:unnamed protein product [Gongylonema pulchrum]|uniref:Ovule protein n=1 Tax=Gongylonema pulchrum TaxID=637853 RepID=A0A183DPN2_9BILA|nr:unnamed protein product [Gongylonema pulchrum]
MRTDDGALSDRFPVSSSADARNIFGTADGDAKSGSSPNDIVSPTVMTSSGFTTSSGFQDSPERSPDKDAEFGEKFSDMTVTLK